MEYLYHTKGGMTEKAYPYTAKTEDCKFNAKDAAVRVIGGSVNITYQDEEELEHVLWKKGPIAIAF